MQKRSRRLRAPFVGVSIEVGDDWVLIGFCGVCGIDFVVGKRCGRGLIGLSIMGAEKIAETSLSSSCAFLFLSIIGVVATASFFSIITFAALLPFETFAKAPMPLVFGKDEAFLGAVDSFRLLVAVGMVKDTINCCGNKTLFAVV